MIRIIGHRGGPQPVGREQSRRLPQDGDARRRCRRARPAPHPGRRDRRHPRPAPRADHQRARRRIGPQPRRLCTRLRLKDTIDETIPTLAQVLDVFEPTGLALELEMKTDARGLPYPGLIEKTAALVERAGNDRPLPAHLLRAGGDRRDAVPKLHAFFVSPRSIAARPRCSGVSSARSGVSWTLTARSPSSGRCSRPNIGRCHIQIGADRLGVWVPNTPGELDFWLRQPVGQITSDRPDLALAIRAQLSAGADSPR